MDDRRTSGRPSASPAHDRADAVVAHRRDEQSSPMPRSMPIARRRAFGAGPRRARRSQQRPVRPRRIEGRVGQHRVPSSRHFDRSSGARPRCGVRVGERARRPSIRRRERRHQSPAPPTSRRPRPAISSSESSSRASPASDALVVRRSSCRSRKGDGSDVGGGERLDAVERERCARARPGRRACGRPSFTRGRLQPVEPLRRVVLREPAWDPEPCAATRGTPPRAPSRRSRSGPGG